MLHANIAMRDYQESVTNIQNNDNDCTILHGRERVNDDFKRSTRYPCLSGLLEGCLALRIKHSYREQARTYRIS